jgi:hypothetical protein
VNRLLSILALVTAAAVIVLALVEIAHREHSTPLASAPTALPSPSASAAAEAPTASSEPSVSEATTVPTPAETAAPPPTATPEPLLATQNAPMTALGTTPHTGANPVPAGVGLTVLAVAGFAVERRTRRSY